MVFTVRILGVEVFAISSDAPAEYDHASDLSGGTTSCARIDAGPTDRYLGFTNGREVE